MCNNRKEEKVPYEKGQRILYDGKEAIVLEVEPVITVQVIGNNQIICGNIMGDISPLKARLSHK